MKYLSGIHALNLKCSLETCGDWHQSALKWENLTWMESDQSIFKDYGIETNREDLAIIGLRKINIANHIRAILDLLVERKFPLAQGMNNDFICNDKYDDEIFHKVMELKNLPYFDEISNFMGKEYKMKWIRFLENVQYVFG